MGIGGWEFAPVAWWMSLDSNQKASWAGAILTAAGLFLALIAPLLHHAWQESNSRRGLFNSIYILAQRSLLQVHLMQEAFKNEEVMARYLIANHAVAMQQIKSMLSSIPLHHFQSAAALISILDVIEAHDTATDVDANMAAVRSKRIGAGVYVSLADEAREKLSGAISELRKLKGNWLMRMYYRCRDAIDARRVKIKLLQS